jgi:hypothetical protein
MDCFSVLSCVSISFWLFYGARTTSCLVTSQAIAQIKPVSSLAIAVHTLTFNNPRSINFGIDHIIVFVPYKQWPVRRAMSFHNVVVDALFYAPGIDSTRLTP